MSNHVQHDPASNATPPVTADPAVADDWAYCQEALREVSRTFSRPIELLPTRLVVPITCSYLLCRIADAIEDHPTLQPARRSTLLELFTAVLEKRADATSFARELPCEQEPTPDMRVAHGLPRVMRVFERIDAAQRRVCVPWIVELALGMSVYARRPADARGLRRLVSLADLGRYCYFVAGTVGRLLTELFLLELPTLPNDQRQLLLEHAEDFGMGLQLVNIIKDVPEDWQRGWCFIPDTTGTTRHAVAATSITTTTCMKPVYALARHHLDIALTYTLALPSSAREIRLFCLLPLWMAARTLVLGEAMLEQQVRDQPVKISRAEVERLIAECVRDSADNDALRRGYQALWLQGAVA